MTLRIYNTLSREKELFDPVRPARVGIYLCGPTVYKPPHIGHMVGPVIFDAIKRYLSYKGFEVNWVVNITDVEDKLIEAAAAQSTTVQALAERHTRDYLACLERLGINNVDYFPKASEHIAEIIDLCTRLIESKHAYAAEGNVYFDVTSDADYGRLSHRKVEEQESGARVFVSTRTARGRAGGERVRTAGLHGRTCARSWCRRPPPRRPSRGGSIRLPPKKYSW